MLASKINKTTQLKIWASRYLWFWQSFFVWMKWSQWYWFEPNILFPINVSFPLLNVSNCKLIQKHDTQTITKQNKTNKKTTTAKSRFSSRYISFLFNLDGGFSLDYGVEFNNILFNQNFQTKCFLVINQYRNERFVINLLDLTSETKYKCCALSNLSLEQWKYRRIDRKLWTYSNYTAMIDSR